MKINEKLNTEINKQINRELYSAYLYLAMSTFFEENNLKGFSHWMKMQSKEELMHAMKFYDYIYSRQGTVKLDSIDKPKQKWKNALEVMNDTYNHETKVTEYINKLMKLAKEKNDYASESMLQWFITEQIEEENSALKIVDQLKQIKDNKSALLMLDRTLMQRPLSNQNTQN